MTAHEHIINTTPSVEFPEEERTMAFDKTEQVNETTVRYALEICRNAKGSDRKLYKVTAFADITTQESKQRLVLALSLEDSYNDCIAEATRQVGNGAAVLSRIVPNGDYSLNMFAEDIAKLNKAEADKQQE